MGGNVNGDSGRLCAGGRLVTTVVSVSAVLTAPGLAPTARATVPLHFMSQATWLVSPGGMPALGLVWTSLSTGSAFGENAVWQKYFCRRGEFCAVGDINGDGRADIILFKSHAVAGVEHGNVLWASASGSGFGAPQYAHGYFCVDDESCYVGDVNGDGRADGLTLKAHYNSPFEAMASLSDGTRWINPNPMTWSTSIRGYTRAAFVSDVNGDGKADLVNYESGDGTGKTKFLVALTSDQPDTTAPPPPPPTPGVAAVNLFNCVPEHDDNGGYRPLYYWTKDLTTGAVNSSGAQEDLYDDSGYCPAAGSQPYTVQLADQHVYQIVAVDPQGIACNGRNDPEQLGCLRQIVAFKGKAGGSTVNVTVPS